ncbi:MAG TPA: helix-turn-helix domain-containing protein [Syntrophales bacterium]|nr:helix-turn-helix domain-containing protein [Syntrophales bacterium]HPN08934.1 helix-turn-helix domain-containing protein [Syntrophales bacterium]HPX80594.1 helix-turn-helix domain-containing protein [Syntrophales bacterium]
MTTRDSLRTGLMEKEFQPQKTGQPIPHPLKRYYRVDEVANYFSVSDRTIYRLIDTGDLKAIRLRDCIRVASEELKRFEALQLDDDMP